MINNKRAATLALTALAAMALAACGSGGSSSQTEATSSESKGTSESESKGTSESASSQAAGLSLSIWCPSTDNDITATLIAGFKAANAAYSTADIKVLANYGEGDVYNAMAKDIEASADIACIADDNIRSAVDGEFLVGLSATEKAALVTTEGQTNVDAASIDGICYGYPYRADNSYMLFYDSTIVSDAHAGSLESILADCKTASAKFAFDLGNGWYDASPLWAAGGYETVNATGLLESNFATQGVAAGGQAWSTLYSNYNGTWISSSDNAAAEAGFATGATTRYGAIVLWNDYNALHAANENVKVTKLPTLKIGENAKQLKAFVGTKDVVIANKKAMTGDKLALAKAFAAFYTNAAAQTARIALGYGPSNATVASSAAASGLPFVQAIAAQAQANGTVAQASTTTSKFWDPVKNWSTLIVNNAPNWGDYGDGATGCLAALQTLVTSEGWTAVS